MSKKNAYRMGVLAGAAALVGFFTAPQAHAALLLEYPGFAAPVIDNGPGDSDPTPGSIINSTFVGLMGVTINIAMSNSPGAPSGGQLQISDLSIHNVAGPGLLDIRVSDTGYTAPGGGGSPMLLTSSVGGTFTNGAIGGDLVAFTSFADPANGQPAGPVATAPLIKVKSLPIDPESFSGDDGTPWLRGAGAYSLANFTHISLSPGATLNFSGSTLATAVPEPASMGIMSAAALILAGRKRRQA